MSDKQVSGSEGSQTEDDACDCDCDYDKESDVSWNSDVSSWIGEELDVFGHDEPEYAHGDVAYIQLPGTEKHLAVSCLLETSGWETLKAVWPYLPNKGIDLDDSVLIDHRGTIHLPKNIVPGIFSVCALDDLATLDSEQQQQQQP